MPGITNDGEERTLSPERSPSPQDQTHVVLPKESDIAGEGGHYSLGRHRRESSVRDENITKTEEDQRHAHGPPGHLSPPSASPGRQLRSRTVGDLDLGKFYHGEVKILKDRRRAASEGNVGSCKDIAKGNEDRPSTHSMDEAVRT